MPQETALPVIVSAPEHTKTGPAMSKLTENQQNFVWAYVETLGQDAGKAAELAGFGGTPGARRVAVHRLMHDEDVIAAINEVAARRMRSHGLMAAEALLSVVMDAGHKDRVKAIGMLLDQAGHITVKKQEITVTRADPTTEEIVARIRRTAEQLGVDPKPLLLNAGVSQTIIDAEFEDVTPGPQDDQRQAAPVGVLLPDGTGREDARQDAPADRQDRGGESEGERGSEPAAEDEWSALR